ASLPLPLAHAVPLLAVAHADAGGVVAVAEVGQLDLVNRDADEVLPLLADELPLGEELAQVVTDASLDDLAEALVVFFDIQDHGVTPITCDSDSIDPQPIRPPSAAVPP